MTTLAPVSNRRRTADRTMRGITLAFTLVALVPLILILYYLITKGLGAWSWSFFTTDPTGKFFGDAGGIKSAILGTIEMVVLATAIAAPVGVGVALWLTEYGKNGRFATLDYSDPQPLLFTACRRSSSVSSSTSCSC